MFSKEIIVSVGLSLCSVILVYLYMKTRINNLENKVDSLIQIIQTHGQLSQSQQQMGGHPQYEKIVVSDGEESSDEEEESDDEEVSDEEEEHEESEGDENNLVLENVVALENEEEAPQEEATVEDEVEEVVASELLELTSVHSLHDMDNEKNDDGLDDMDDLDENLEEEDEEVDYSKMSKVELKEQCSAMGLETKGKKKHELLALLTA
jgi:hypothetical protein